MRCWNTLWMLALAACDGGFGFGTEPGFFGDSGMSVGESDTNLCFEPSLGSWPDEARVDPTAWPEVLLAPGMSARTSSWWNAEDELIAHTREVVSMGETSVLRLVPETALDADLNTTWTVSFEDDPEVLLCRYSLDGQLHTGPRGTLATPAEIEGRSWWLPLDERNDSSGVLLGRLISRTGPTAGRALALSVHGQQLWIGSVVRDPYLPADPCDTTDVIALSSTTAELAATAARVTLEDPTTPLALRDLVLTGLVTEGGDKLEAVHLKASLDVSGLAESTRTTFCALAEEIGRPCAPCDEAEPASLCIPIDARGLYGAALDADLDQVEDGGTCAR